MEECRKFDCTNDRCCGLAEILEDIVALQERAEIIEDANEGCDKPFLGPCPKNDCYNTRPITLFNNESEPLRLPFEADGERGTSSVLRCEKVEGCTCTFRILAPNHDSCSKHPYVKTNSFCTLNIGCCWVLQCMPDTFVDCL